MTIVEAILEVMRRANQPVTIHDIYEAIVHDGLYTFRAEDPVHVVRTTVRRHTNGLDFPSSSPSKHFIRVENDRYWILETNGDKAGKDRPRSNKSQSRVIATNQNTLTETLTQLQILRERYISELETKILTDLHALSPSEFEYFARRLIQAYGFEEVKVTPSSGDGGIDGYGKLKVGLAYINVAFQCKRWTKGRIQRPEIDRFRGAIQGEYEQGLFFTTTSFSVGAVGASVKRGAVPIVLVDGISIARLMIERGLGVARATLSVPSYALDLLLSGEDANMETSS